MNYFYTVILFALLSCSQKAKQKAPLEAQLADTLETNKATAVKLLDSVEKTPQKHVPNLNDFNAEINAMLTKTLPLTDATNFDSFIDPDDYNLVNIDALQLMELYPNYYKEGYNYKAIASYKIALSKTFHTTVITLRKGDNEMESVLITYNLDGTIIDSKVIAYDEIAEGQSRIESQLEGNTITTNHIFWADDKQITTKVYTINTRGEIVKKNAND